ncbi:RmlC-like cupin domain-containing protein [Kockovaella imperatae]|uniref:RmlC-like cupin domain-containing protein n=1 Tax=Kockovaella imperatae TaxID=4999 RepID=A0A1Y1UN90_9TREE|nr:RmlC-like cupin domain-containing protein [Kockovaella imperatae]ORX38987.1 RmlC-like cupin domain-containing protein [Kockovaella imperatae]
MQFQVRPSETRGGADHGWLKTFHTFSFADYWDPSFNNFGALRVVNEDRVAPTTGFPTHEHREAEIFSYIISGELSHKDSMGNVETMKRGDIQHTVGGQGIAHSEYNSHNSVGNHFLQVWATPNQRGLKPKYYTRHFTDDEKADKLAHIVAPIGSPNVLDQREDKVPGSSPSPINAALNTFATVLSPGKSLQHTFQPTIKGVDGAKIMYAHLTQTSGFNTKAAAKDGKTAVIRIKNGDSEAVLGEGDGLFIRGAKTGDVLEIESTGGSPAELVLFEMDQ